MKMIDGSRFLFFSALMVFFPLLQSCGGVYNSTNLSVERALEIDQPVKIKTTKGTVYKIKELEKDENGIFGLHGRNQMLPENIKRRLLKEITKVKI